MKWAGAIAIFSLLALCASAARLGEDKTITKVVKMLQGILETSKATGDAERTAYAKYMCDCDKRSTEYKGTIATSDESISMLADSIAGLQADNGKLSVECAELQADMAANRAAKQDAVDLRTKQNGEFVALETDLKGAIKQLGDAIDTLAEVNADQTAEDATARDHDKFMAGYKTKYNPVALLKTKSSLQAALSAASAFMDKKKAHVVASFMQAPFTGSYTSQSVEVMGILKNMLDTFEGNLKAATATEAEQLAAHEALIKIKDEQYGDMSKSYDKKQGELAANDDTLSSKKEQKKTTEDTMAEATSFLETTEDMCAAKKAEYSKRRMLQVQEEAAITEAISILDSDAAFAVFGTVNATSTGSSFLQLKSVQKHTMENDLRSELVQTFQKVKGSTRLSKLVSMVRATNPFEVVLDEIDKMLKLIVEEGTADKNKLDFCNTERTANYDLIATKTSSIEEKLKPTILEKETLINNPVDGLKKQISDAEASLALNQKNQKESTDTRAQENLLYQQDMKNLAETKALLEKAITVLDTYYKKLMKELSLLQRQPKSTLGNTVVPTADMAELKMKGESESGNAVIAQLQTILGATKTEESDAIEAEKAAKGAFDKEMDGLKGEESDLQTSLATNRAVLATTEKDLLTLKEELKTTEAEKAAAEAYLADIKPGCDFITNNIVLRDSNRAEETASLKGAKTLLMGSPVYVNYKSEVHTESLGKCVAKCGVEESAVCKACLADVTVVAYCAGHKDTPGC